MPRGAMAGARIETIDGYHVARWSDANLAYVAVSDMDSGFLSNRNLARFGAGGLKEQDAGARARLVVNGRDPCAVAEALVAQPSARSRISAGPAERRLM